MCAISGKISLAIYNDENANLSAFEVGRQSNPGIDLISIIGQLLAAFGPVFTPPVIAITSVLLGTMGIAVANALFQAEQDRINAEAAAAIAPTTTTIPTTTTTLDPSTYYFLTYSILNLIWLFFSPMLSCGHDSARILKTIYNWYGNRHSICPGLSDNVWYY